MTKRRSSPANAAGASREYGYHVESDTVLFEYELTGETNLVSDDRTGAWSRIEPRGEHVCDVAGDFNGWQPIRLKRNPRVSLRYGEFVRRDQLPGPRHAFKFRLDGHLWVEPPSFASNVESSGIAGSDARNLVLTMPAKA